MKAYRWSDARAPLIRTSAVGGAEWSASLPIRFSPGRYSQYFLNKMEVGTHNQFGRFGEKNPFPCKDLKPEWCSSLLDHYIDHAIQALKYFCKILLATG